MSESEQSESEAIDQLEDLRRRLGDIPIHELTPEQQEQLLKATQGMFRPAKTKSAADKSQEH